MKTMKLSATQITDLQPTAVEYASDRGMVLGGIEVSGDIEHEEVCRAAAQYFGGDARLDDGEPCDGDGCVHYIVIEDKDQE